MPQNRLQLQPRPLPRPIWRRNWISFPPNQQLEGFEGTITEAVARHQPNMEEIAEEARRFGAQVPTEENRKRPPLFPHPKA